MKYQIIRLQIDGFRGIEAAAIEFARGQATVLVGKNGAGKSAVLDCLAILFLDLCSQLSGEKGKRWQFSNDDISNDRKDLRCTLTLETDEGKTIDWPVRAHRTRAGSARIGYTDENGTTIQELHEILGPEAQLALPLTVKYGIDRADVDPIAVPRSLKRNEPINPYEQALDRGSGNFREFVSWFREREDVENQELAHGDRGPDPQLAAVRRAVQAFVPGLGRLRIERRRSPPRLVVGEDRGQLSLDQLSHGQRSLLAMVGDLARRLAMLYSELGEPLEGPAWVLIDELELHLHPGWQRSTLPLLCRTFPNSQFIVTTHSPQVLADVPGDAVRILRRNDGKLDVAVPDAAYGLDSNRLLVDVLEDVERPEEIKRWLAGIYDHIARDDLERARIELARLAETITPNDPEVGKIEALIHRREVLGR